MARTTKCISAFILLLATVTGSSKAYAQELLTPEELRADLDYYFTTLYSRHPDPYYFYSLSDFEERKNNIYAQVESPLTLQQFSWVAGQINSLVDLHSLTKFTFQGYSMDELVSAGEKVFPFVRIEEDRIFLKNDPVNPIAQINGVSVDTILADHRQYFNWKLPHEVTFRMMEAMFPVFVRFKYHLRSPFQLTFLDGTCREVEGNSIDQAIKEDPYGVHRANSSDFSYQIYPSSSMAIFNLNNFGNTVRNELADSFAKFSEEVNRQRISYVFYDVSKNGGGNHIGDIALNVINHDTIFFKYTMIQRGETGNRKYTASDKILPPHHDSAIPDDRMLFVIQGPKTMSGGDYFCRLVAENRLGVLVGQNTGEATVTFSLSHDFTMPHSKINFAIASSLMDFSEFFSSETVTPDIYWDVNHNREFTEKELNEIIRKWRN